MHYSAFVVVPNAANHQEEVERLMAPFSENDGENEDGKWDWYQIGGRWTGALTGYKPEEDEKNIEVCKWCEGTGKRNDPIGIAHRAQNPDYTCNGCSGKGKSVKWPTSWAKYDGDIQPVEKVIAGLTNGTIHEPHDILGPAGEWLNPTARVEHDIKMVAGMEERLKTEGKEGELDFMAKYIKEQKEQKQDGSTATILGRWPGHFVVVIDYHS